MNAILWLDDARAQDVGQAGGKGASLARMMAAGFRVPPGFIVTSPATRPLVAGQSVSSHVEDAIRAAVARLGDIDLAVRSSGVDEDSADRSFAGQHLTLLGVRGADAVLNAIARCAQSVHSEAAVAYRASNPAGASLEIAVIVQVMIEPEVAGVAFSVDPVTGDASRIVVEAVAGRGAGLVDGTVEADRAIVVRETMTALETTHPGAPVLVGDLAVRIAHATLEAERLFDRPQDIEFAIAGGTLWMLQSRPVTVTGAPTSLDGGWTSEFDTPTTDDDLWTSANVQEVLPGLLTPLTMTAFQEHATTAYTIGYQEVRLLKKHEWPVFVGTFYNRAFLNVAAARMVADRAIGSSGDSVEHRFLGGEMKSDTPKPPFLVGFRDRLWSAPFLTWMTLTIRRDLARVEKRALSWQRRMERTRFDRLSDAELEKLRADAMAFSAESVKVHLRVTGMAGTAFEWIAALVRPVLKDETEGIVPLLFSGMRGVESAQISLDLWDLAQAARAAGLADRLAEDGFDPRDTGLPAAWRSAYGAFMERHGHRGLNEMEISAKSWRSDPKPVMQVVASYLAMPAESSPAATLDRQEAARRQLTDDLAAKMAPPRRIAFKRFLKEAQAYVAMREQMKSVIVRSMRLGDYTLPEYQRRLVIKECIAEPGDIFFLTNPEIRAQFTGAERVDYRLAVARRRKEYERNRYVVLPERFRGHPVPVSPAAHLEGATTLTGTPVSPGIVTAKARVILDPREDGPLLPGEILVAPVTDAGWTPLFAIASGLVVDMGSALSHGSTVAREYGLPAVVNVRSATRLIRTGDLVTIDGARGIVAVEPVDPAE